MSSLRYFEFDSTYRNRTQYSSPADFVIDISQSGQKSREVALDPVSNASPILEWNNSFQEGAVSNTITGITLSPIAGAIGNTTFEITSTLLLRQVNNFYSGASIYIIVDGVTYARRIISYQYINTTHAIITLDSPMADEAINAGANAIILNPTPLATNTGSGAVIKFFIPTGSAIDNFYVNYMIQVLGTAIPLISPFNTRITAYDGTTRLATLESKTPQDWSTSGNANLNFAIRKEIPIATGALYGVSPSLTSIQLDVDNLVNTVSGQYANFGLRMTLPLPTTAGFSSVVAPFQEEVVIKKYIAGSGTFASNGVGTTFVLSPTAGTENYTNCWITNTTIASPHSSGYIVYYDPTTYTGTVSAWSGLAPTAGDQWSIVTALINPPLGAAPALYTALAYELEQFSRENYTPFSYNGSLVSSQQEVCYEIELINLVLPNSLLQSGRGGRAIFYPYLYVELQQVAAASSHQRGVIYSNNPNAYKMLFRALVNDTATPAASPFIRIDGDGMTHVIKFKPNDSFKFGVYHADGTLFQTVATDTTPPTEPNPMVQISACFSFKRI